MSGGLVCRECFLANPHGDHRGIDCRKHPQAERCNVVWSATNNCFTVQLIRPVPDKYISGRFIMCNFDQRCKGDRCTYAHSDAELKEWNRSKQGSSNPGGKKMLAIFTHVALPRLSFQGPIKTTKHGKFTRQRSDFKQELQYFHEASVVRFV